MPGCREQLAQLGQTGQDQGRRRLGLRGVLRGRFAAQHEHAERVGPVGHENVRVNSIAHHGDLPGAEAVARHNPAKHRGVGLAENDVGAPAGGGLERGAN